jgi:L-aminopeptidase/D-esterase-like protein
MTLTAVPGVEVGHWTDPVARTGVTVITFPEPNVAAVEVRGGAPGSRELAILGHGMRVETIQALVFSGGSAFGLASVDGVVRRLEADGRGHPTLMGRVPIVPAAVVYDLAVGDPAVRPGPGEGASAYDARSSDPVAVGRVGAGTGASVAGWRGPDARRDGGVGSAAVVVAHPDGGAGPDREGVVAALVVVNAVGDAFTLEGEPLTGGPHVPAQVPVVTSAVMEQTTLVAVAVDAGLSRADLSRVIVRSHDALGVCFRPAHTRFDGDAVFAVATGGVPGDVEAVAEAAFEATGRAVEVAVRAGAGR